VALMNGPSLKGAGFTIGSAYNDKQTQQFYDERADNPFALMSPDDYNEDQALFSSGKDTSNEDAVIDPSSSSRRERTGGTTVKKSIPFTPEVENEPLLIQDVMTVRISKDG